MKWKTNFSPAIAKTWVCPPCHKRSPFGSTVENLIVRVISVSFLYDISFLLNSMKPLPSNTNSTWWYAKKKLSNSGTNQTNYFNKLPHLPFLFGVWWWLMFEYLLALVCLYQSPLHKAISLWMIIFLDKYVFDVLTCFADKPGFGCLTVLRWP